ncbi:uncharacterized protein FOMMEDRAFT_165595, partial [Fomitiporia mediterranea MF3/22]|uniref:uncharacterized protein n=1 Tax=Fomitiporia mediterranea (strain MF3/22) TaxID=694068 RepID=UPI0004407F01
MLRCLLTPRNTLIQHVQRCEAAFIKSTLVAGWSRGRRFAQSRVLSSTPDHNDATKKREVNGGTRPGRTKAVHDFAFLISERNARSASPKLQTPHDIKAFYRAIQTKGLLRELSPEESSSIIQLFASLSLLPDPSDDSPIPDDNMSGNFAFHPLAPVLSKHQISGTRQHWSFVLMVAKDKLSCGLTLAESDNYWLMRAAIEDAKRKLDEDPK